LKKIRGGAQPPPQQEGKSSPHTLPRASILAPTALDLPWPLPFINSGSPLAIYTSEESKESAAGEAGDARVRLLWEYVKDEWKLHINT